MKRLALTASVLISAGCLFGGESLDENNSNNDPNNLTVGPNNVTPNNVTPNNVVVNNVTPNNIIEPPPNNVAPNNIEPNNLVACPDIAPPPGCNLPFTCSPGAEEGCEQCGLCAGDGLLHCAAGPGGQLGLCIETVPIFTAQDLNGDPADGVGQVIAVDDGRIYIGWPGRMGRGAVVVTDLEGTELARLPGPSDQGRFGAAIDAFDGRLVVGCPGCGANGQAYFFGDPANNPANSAPLVESGQLNAPIGESVAGFRSGGESVIAIGAPTAGVLHVVSGTPFTRNSLPPSSLTNFGVSLAADAGAIVVGSTLPVANLITFEAGAPESTPIVKAKTSPARHVAISTNDAVGVLAGGRDLEVFRDGVTGGEVDSGGDDWIAVATTGGLVFAGLSSGEIRVFEVKDGLPQVGSLMIPGLTDLDISDDVLVVGAGAATADDAIYAYRISILGLR